MAVKSCSVGTEMSGAFLSWLMTKAVPHIGAAAARVMRTKNYRERFSLEFVNVDYLC